MPGALKQRLSECQCVKKKNPILITLSPISLVPFSYLAVI